MRLEKLSPTSAAVYEKCPARWAAEQRDHVPQIQSSAAALGTACHGALERVVLDKAYLKDEWYADLTEAYKVSYWEVFSTPERYDEGLKILKGWYARNSLRDNEILSAEVKNTFPLKTSAGTIQITYIWDRCDRHADGVIEVVDYKSYASPISPNSLHGNIQARFYALAAQMEYPEAESIRITFDLLRFEDGIVSTVFTKEDNRETFRYVRALAERIIADETAKERINDQCNWCVRMHGCQTLAKHIAGDGRLSISDPYDAADRRADLVNAKKAIESMVEDLDSLILQFCEREEIYEFSTGNGVEVSISARRNRKIDPQAVLGVLGPEILGRFGDVSMKGLDAMLKSSELTGEQKSQIKQLIKIEFGNPSVKTKQAEALA